MTGRYVAACFGLAILLAVNFASAQALLVKPTSASFGGKVLTEDPTRLTTFTLYNNSSGFGAFRITSATITGPGRSSYSIIHEPSYAPLPPAHEGNTAVGVVFHPMQLGLATAYLELVTEYPVTTQQIHLSGAGVPARGSVHYGAFTGLGPGQSTIGTGGNYPTLKAACADISNKYLTGGDWTFLILNDLTEQNSVSLGVHHTNGHTITFRPAPGTQPTVTFPAAGRFYIGTSAIESAVRTRTSTQRIVIDGSTTPGGTDQSLIFRNTGAADAGSLIHILGDCDYLTLKNLKVNCFPAQTDNYPKEAIRFDAEINPHNTAYNAPVIAGEFSDFSRVENCEITINSRGPGYGLFQSVTFPPSYIFSKFPLPGATGFVIRNNRLQSNGGGIYLLPMQDAIISSNTMEVSLHYEAFQPRQSPLPPETPPTPAIEVDGCPQAEQPGTFVITGNRIRMLNAETANNFAGIAYRGNSPAGTIVDISNNMISGITAAATGGAAVKRIAVVGLSGQPTTVSISHNSMELTNKNLSSTATLTAAIGTINTSHNGSVHVRNNIIRVEGPGAAAYNFSPGSGPVVADNNNIFTTSGSIVGHFGGVSYNTLQEWTAGTGYDQSSIQVDPFVATSAGAGTWTRSTEASETDLHFSAFPGETYLAPRIDSVGMDIDGEERTGPVTVMGADEVARAPARIRTWELY